MKPDSTVYSGNDGRAMFAALAFAESVIKDLDAAQKRRNAPRAAEARRHGFQHQERDYLFQWERALYVRAQELIELLRQ